jgi:predicted NAD-dependent protein-ADP-ribosyltransferase YbiA (DUF1768 family)
MKTNNIRLLSAAFLITAIAAVSVSCKSKKQAPSLQSQTGAVEISVPFTGKEFQSDKEYFRSKALGNSMDLSTAKKIALQNAKSEMASLIQTTVKKVTEQYTNQRQIASTQEFSNKFEEMSREVTNQVLTDVRIIGEKQFRETNGTYTWWIAVEANKETVLNGINKSISNNQRLQQDYDRKKFEEIFNSEMDKLAKERGY